MFLRSNSAHLIGVCRWCSSNLVSTAVCAAGAACLCGPVRHKVGRRRHGTCLSATHLHPIDPIPPLSPTRAAGAPTRRCPTSNARLGACGHSHWVQRDVWCTHPLLRARTQRVPRSSNPVTLSARARTRATSVSVYVEMLPPPPLPRAVTVGATSRTTCAVRWLRETIPTATNAVVGARWRGSALDLIARTKPPPHARDNPSGT
jgi:hypothetical protein